MEFCQMAFQLMDFQKQLNNIFQIGNDFPSPPLSGCVQIFIHFGGQRSPLDGILMEIIGDIDQM